MYSVSLKFLFFPGLKALDSLKSLEAKTTELSGNFAEYQKGMKEENKNKDQVGSAIN